MANSDGIPPPAADRLLELERENARLREEVARVTDEQRALWQTLRVLAPNYLLTEPEMLQALADPVPFAAVVEEAERAAGVPRAT
jgi:predicted nuclease with TOPRIM domain